MATINLTDEHQALIANSGHTLVLGGPGAGKTTISLIKAANNISDGRLAVGQKILFLSFARTTVARVEERAKELLPLESLKRVEISTYHGFIWTILRSHGHLICPHGQPSMLPPPEASALLAECKDAEHRQAEKERLFWEEGLIHFDEFAPVCAELLNRSSSLTNIICDAFPIIVLDEFQDTNKPEWRLIKRLAEFATIIALADAEQRIYEFRGADPARISQYIDFASPSQYDFGTNNNRSAGTDIVQYGNDLLTGANKGAEYQNVDVLGYRVMKGIGRHLDLKARLLNRRQQLIGSGHQNWSIALLVPTKALMVDVSDYLSSEQPLTNGRRLPVVTHDVALETQGPSLAAKVISSLLDQSSSSADAFAGLIAGVCEYLRGRKANSGPNQTMNGCYSNATEIVQQALLQEHFASATKEWSGVHVMTMHKSKGKEFTETIIYEGSHYSGRIVPKGEDNQEAQRRLLLRVAVTRAMKHVSILTPRNDPCPLL